MQATELAEPERTEEAGQMERQRQLLREAQSGCPKLN